MDEKTVAIIFVLVIMVYVIGVLVGLHNSNTTYRSYYLTDDNITLHCQNATAISNVSWNLTRCYSSALPRASKFEFNISIKATP
jgi:uncharacterized membrane protein